MNNSLVDEIQRLEKIVEQQAEVIIEQGGVITLLETKCRQKDAEIERLKEGLEEIKQLAYDARHKVCGYSKSDVMCDCKYIGVGVNSGLGGEHTGCCEFREIETTTRQALKGEDERMKR